MQLPPDRDRGRVYQTPSVLEITRNQGPVRSVPPTRPFGRFVPIQFNARGREIVNAQIIPRIAPPGAATLPNVTEEDLRRMHYPLSLGTGAHARPMTLAEFHENLARNRRREMCSKRITWERISNPSPSPAPSLSPPMPLRGIEQQHQQLIWTLRGNVTEVTAQAQAFFQFNPPLSEAFVALNLNGLLAAKHLDFLQTYFPGEVHTIQRATARVHIFRNGIKNDAVYYGRQTVTGTQLNRDDPRYPPMIMPASMPRRWDRKDDAALKLLIGKSPFDIIRDYAWIFGERIKLDAIRARATQLLYVKFSDAELEAASARLSVTQRQSPFVGQAVPRSWISY